MLYPGIENVLFMGKRAYRGLLPNPFCRTTVCDAVMFVNDTFIESEPGNDPEKVLLYVDPGVISLWSGVDNGEEPGVV
jgi:hypothetical protein